MNASRTVPLRRSLVCGLLTLLCTAFTVAAAGPKRVLIVHSFGRDFAPFDAMSSTFRTELARQSPDPVEFYETSIETARFAEEGNERQLLDYLRALFAGRRPDLIVTIAEPATFFCVRNRAEFFPDTPLLAQVDHRAFPIVQKAPNVALAPVYVRIPVLMENILTILPETTNVLMVLGASPFERVWADRCRAEFAPFSNRVSVTFTCDLPLEAIRERAARMPPRSAVLYAMLAVDAAGVPHEQDNALASLRAAANAPLFGVFESQLGQGVIGGPLLPLEESGRQGARTALRLFRGERAGELDVPAEQPAAPVYDWRELRRWNIPESRLPSGSVVLYRPPSQWDEHKGIILAAIGVFTAQFLTIAGLLLHRARYLRAESARKHAEGEAQRQRAELAHVARVSTMGELAASVAHELNQPLGAILSNAEAAELFLNQDPPALGELRDILADIRKDAERAGEVIRRMRTLLRKRELELQPLEINPVVEEVLRLVNGDAALRKTTVATELAPGLPLIRGDRVHLQQVLLNLMLNALEAMARQPAEQRRLTVRTSLDAAGRVTLTVADTGGGIDPDKLPRLFDPFFTTKPNGMGMGLAIARRIVEAHRGTIVAENHATGATFCVTLPAAMEEAKA